MTQDEYLSELRGLLAEGPSAALWGRLCRHLERMNVPELRELGISYTSEHVAGMLCVG